MGKKNTECYADCNALKKLQKTHAENVINKKMTKNGVFDFCYCVQRFFAYKNLLG